MMLGSSTTRLMADKRVGSTTYQRILEEWMEEKGHRDLKSLVKPIEQAYTWKNSPTLEVQYNFVSLYARLFLQNRNTVMNHQALKKGTSNITN